MTVLEFFRQTDNIDYNSYADFCQKNGLKPADDVTFALVIDPPAASPVAALAAFLAERGAHQPTYAQYLVWCMGKPVEPVNEQRFAANLIRLQTRAQRSHDHRTSKGAAISSGAKEPVSNDNAASVQPVRESRSRRR